VDEAVEDGVGIGWVADHRVPVLDGKLTGDDGGSAAVAIFENLEQVVASLGVKRVEPPIVENEELDAAQRAADAGISAIAARERQLAEQFGDALIEDRAVVAASLMAKRASKPTLADAGRTADDQIVVRVDPIAGHELLEEWAIEATRGAVIDILDEHLLAKPGIAQPGGDFLVVPVGHLPVEQKSQPFRMGERRRLGAAPWRFWKLRDNAGPGLPIRISSTVGGFASPQPEYSSTSTACQKPRTSSPGLLRSCPTGVRKSSVGETAAAHRRRWWRAGTTPMPISCSAHWVLRFPGSPGLGAVQRPVQLGDPLAIDLGEIGVKAGQGGYGAWVRRLISPLRRAIGLVEWSLGRWAAEERGFDSRLTAPQPAFHRLVVLYSIQVACQFSPARLRPARSPPANTCQDGARTYSRGSSPAMIGRCLLWAAVTLAVPGVMPPRAVDAHDWYSDLRQPITGRPCCGGYDCRPLLPEQIRYTVAFGERAGYGSLLLMDASDQLIQAAAWPGRRSTAEAQGSNARSASGPRQQG
jgi:hypothetical protein